MDVRIRLGDIEIDGNVVRIGADVPQASQQPPPPQMSLDTAPTPSLKMLPVPSRILVRSGAVLLLVGIVLLTVAPPSSVLSFLLHMMPLTLGVGVLGLGTVKRYEERRELHTARLRDEAELTPHVDRVRGVLGEPRSEQTVEWTAATLRLPEATVVRVLDRLRKQGEVEEELNVETGEWYYFARRDLGAIRGDLESRMAALKKGRTE